MKQPIVSFITAVKDRQAELKEMLESLIKQDIEDWEAVIVDDHSKEPIKEVVEKFQEKRFHYFKLPKDKTGISNARNLAIEKAKSNIMLTADGDDINEPSRAKITYEIMTKKHCDVFYSRVRDFIPGQKGVARELQPFHEKLLPMFNFMTNASCAFLRDKFLKLGGFDPNFIVCEDFDLYLRFLNSGAKFCYTQKILVNYRNSPEGISSKKYSLLHKYFQKARIKNKIPPFDIEKVKKYALPSFAEDILTKHRKLFGDDRFKNKRK